MKKLSHTSTHQSEGFTIIELLVFVAVIAAAGLFAIVNIRSVRSENRDSSQKTDVNTIVYQLESSYQKKNFYPKNIDATTLKGIDQDTLVDVNGIKINETSGSYVYKPLKCDGEKCQSYELIAKLEKEAPYVKKSLR
jgi:type II secretory pathway pseudopilin PulG